MRQRLLGIPGYTDLADQLYFGQKGRQMVLGDILAYMLTGRGYWTAVESPEKFQNFLKVRLYVCNLLLLQESLLSASSKAQQRRRILTSLEKHNIDFFFATPAEEDLYKKLKAYPGLLTPRDPRDLYKVMDSVAPKPLGTVGELVVYLHLLNRRLGYVIPLLFIQRIFRGIDYIAPPDYLLLRPGGEIFGVEVGSGIGQFSLTQGKIDQVNRFVQDTSIPVVTAVVPHLYRCATCEEWITFCDRVIDEMAAGESEKEVILCQECDSFNQGKCTSIIYYGQTKIKGQRLRHHYHHFHGNSSHYVNNTGLRRSPEKKLLQYFPVVEGLDRLTSC